MRAAALKLRQPHAAHLRNSRLECRVCTVCKDEHRESTAATAATCTARLLVIAALV
jgi:hypothetical protein